MARRIGPAPHPPPNVRAAAAPYPPPPGLRPGSSPLSRIAGEGGPSPHGWVGAAQAARLVRGSFRLPLGLRYAEGGEQLSLEADARGASTKSGRIRPTGTRPQCAVAPLAAIFEGESSRTVITSSSMPAISVMFCTRRMPSRMRSIWTMTSRALAICTRIARSAG